MSEHVRSRSEWKIIEDQESSQPVGPLVDQQSSDEQAQQEEPPSESEDITPAQEKGDAGATEVQGERKGPDTEAKFQEMAQPKTLGEGKDGPDVHGKNLPNLKCSEMPEAGPDPEAVLQEKDQQKTGGSDPEAVLQEQDHPKIGSEETDGPYVEGKTLTNIEPISMPEAGPDLEVENLGIDRPDLAQPEIWGEDTDDPLFRWEISPRPEPVYMPEAGDGKPLM